MSENWNTEVHPNWYKDVSPMRYLILGSFPPHEDRRAYQFYYPSRRNRFWRILADLAGQTLQSKRGEEVLAVEERYAIMKKLEVGVQNLGLEIQRKDKSALDTHIRIIKFHDVISIIESHPELQRILLPGFSARDSTARSFIRYLQERGLRVPEIEVIKPHTVFVLEYKGRPIECVILNSTSPASKIQYGLLLEQFRKYLI